MNNTSSTISRHCERSEAIQSHNKNLSLRSGLPRTSGARSDGFTLIELSIVLVIIGLIVGGVLVGQDLIKAASIRSTISQVQEFDTAANTFRLKYNCLPGDCKPAQAQTFGFLSREGGAGCGNGDRVIRSFYTSDGGEAIDFADISPYVACLVTDESELFWSDLSRSKLIAKNIIQNFSDTVEEALPKTLDDAFLVAANGNISNALGPFGYTLIGYSPEVSQFGNLITNTAYTPLSNSDAHTIDTKMDDGDPINGSVYTLDQVPGFGASPDKGALAGCSIDNGDGTGAYDITNPAEDVCIIKIRGSI